jgi:hypothetical protein
MIAPSLVRLIETHSDQLAQGLLERFLGDPRIADIRKVPQDELRERSREIYRNLSDWLLTKTESDVERTYGAVGARRAAQGVSLSHLVGAILTTKEHLWAFLREEVSSERPVELFQELELFHLVDQFFDRAVYYAALGYERQKPARAA